MATVAANPNPNPNPNLNPNPNPNPTQVDYYHAQTLLSMDDAALTAKAKADLDTMLGATCRAAKVADAIGVRV